MSCYIDRHPIYIGSSSYLQCNIGLPRTLLNEAFLASNNLRAQSKLELSGTGWHRMQRALDGWWKASRSRDTWWRDRRCSWLCGIMNTVRPAFWWHWKTRAELSSRAGVLVGSKGCLVMLEMTWSRQQSSLLLLTNNESLKFYVSCNTHKKLHNLHCDMRNISFRKPNNAHELGMQNWIDQGLQNPINNTQSGTQQTKTLAHIEGQVLLFWCLGQGTILYAQAWT